MSSSPTTSPEDCPSQNEKKPKATRFLDALIFDCRFLVYGQLITEALTRQLGNSKLIREDSSIFALSLTCRDLRGEIEYFLELYPQIQRARGVGIGLHDPSLVTWRLRPVEEYCTGGHLPRGLSPLDVTCLRNLEVHETSDCLNARKTTVFGGIEHCYGHILRLLKHLRHFDIVFVNPDLTDNAVDMMATLLALWDKFWDSIPFCHPKLACSCCSDLPILRWRIEREGLESGSVSKTKTISRRVPLPVSWEVLVEFNFKMVLKKVKVKRSAKTVVTEATFLRDYWYGLSCL